jgi:perosamine synthetase
MRGHTSDMDAILRLCADAGVPVIEDAAHSLGTLWDGKPIGTLGRIGCFSFQSYKLVNSGEGGMLVTDDAELAARAVIMSGAYEQNWKKHAVVGETASKWQNRLPLYNMRLQNLSAAILRPQVPLIAARAEQGRRNHDLVAAILNGSPWLSVPPPLPKELRAPDSLQFLLRGFSDAESLALQDAARRRGVSVQVFGLSEGNARAFWNWGFLPDRPALPKTRAMLNRACDTRLPSRLTSADCRLIAEAILAAAIEVKAPLAVAGA